MLNDNANKLKAGLARREEIRKKLEAGENVVNYRTAWIRETASKVIDVLKQSSIEFNTKHEDDKTSALDLIDVIATVDGLLKGTIK